MHIFAHKVATGTNDSTNFLTDWNLPLLSNPMCHATVGQARLFLLYSLHEMK